MYFIYFIDAVHVTLPESTSIDRLNIHPKRSENINRWENEVVNRQIMHQMKDD